MAAPAALNCGDACHCVRAHVVERADVEAHRDELSGLFGINGCLAIGQQACAVLNEWLEVLGAYEELFEFV